MPTNSPYAPANLRVCHLDRSFYRRFLPRKRRKRKSYRTDTRNPEDDSLVDSPIREHRESEKHRERRHTRGDDSGVEFVVVTDRSKSKVIENGGGLRREREKSRYRREEDEESLVDSVDRNEAEKIVRRRERARMENGGGGDERYRVREKRREYFERDEGR